MQWLRALTNGGFRHCKAAPFSSYLSTAGGGGPASSDKNGIFAHGGAPLSPVSNNNMLQDLALFLEQLKEVPDEFWFKDIWQNDIGAYIGSTSLAICQNAIIQAIRIVKTKFPNCLIKVWGPGAANAYYTAGGSSNQAVSLALYTALKSWMLTEFTGNDAIAKGIIYVTNDSNLDPATVANVLAMTTIDGVHTNSRGALLRAYSDYLQTGYLYPNRLEIPATPWASGQPLTLGGNPDFSVISTTANQGSTAAGVLASGIVLNTVSGANMHYDTIFYNNTTNKQVTVNWANPSQNSVNDISNNNGIIVNISANSSFVNGGTSGPGASSVNTQIGKTWSTTANGGIAIPAKLTLPITFAVRVKLLQPTGIHALGIYMQFGPSGGGSGTAQTASAYFPEDDATYYEHTANPQGISGILPAGTELTLLLPTVMNTTAANTIIREALLTVELVSGTTASPVSIQIESMCAFQENSLTGALIYNPVTNVPYVNETNGSQSVYIDGGATFTSLTWTINGSAKTLPVAFTGEITLAAGDSINAVFAAGSPVFTISPI